MKTKAVILLLFILTGTYTTIEAQRRFRGKKVVVVKKRPGLRPARVVVRPVPRTINRLPATAIRIIHRGRTYHIANGFFYVRRDGVFTRVIPTRGLRVRTVPGTVVAITVAGVSYNYANGVYYKAVEDEFEVVAPVTGAIVPSLPDDAEMVEIDGLIYYEYDNFLYRSVETSKGEAYEAIGPFDE